MQTVTMKKQSSADVSMYNQYAVDANSGITAKAIFSSHLFIQNKIFMSCVNKKKVKLKNYTLRQTSIFCPKITFDIMEKMSVKVLSKFRAKNAKIYYLVKSWTSVTVCCQSVFIPF